MPAPLLAAVAVDRATGGHAKRWLTWGVVVTGAALFATLLAAFAPVVMPAAAGSCGPGVAVPSSAELPPSMVAAINALKADYEAAAATTGLSWALLAGIDFRESGNDPMRSALGGELGWPATAVDSGIVSADKRESLVHAGEHIKAMASSVYGVTLTAASGGPDVAQALLAYNRGSSYLQASRPPTDSPYVYNQYDAAHTDMVFPAIPGETLAGMTDYRHGAFTVFTRLGGSAGSCGLSDDEIVRIAQQQLGLAEVPDGCNCGEPIQKFLGSSAGEAWCADFVSWVYRDASHPFSGGADGGWRIAGVSAMVAWLEAHGRWFPAGSAEDPRPGDVIAFGDADHIGIVERLDGATVRTIEGNTSNMVARRSYARVGDGILGWGRTGAAA